MARMCDMSPYPPTPTVEDETIALAKELGTSEASRKHREDHEVPSRGDVNQIPVLVESDAEPVTKRKQHKSTSSTFSSKPRNSTTSMEGQDSGLLTPPASDSDNETAIRGRSQEEFDTTMYRPPRSRSPSRSDTLQSRAPSVEDLILDQELQNNDRTSRVQQSMSTHSNIAHTSTATEEGSRHGSTQEDHRPALNSRTVRSKLVLHSVSDMDVADDEPGRATLPGTSKGTGGESACDSGTTTTERATRLAQPAVIYEYGLRLPERAFYRQNTASPCDRSLIGRASDNEMNTNHWSHGPRMSITSRNRRDAESRYWPSTEIGVSKDNYGQALSLGSDDDQMLRRDGHKSQRQNMINPGDTHDSAAPIPVQNVGEHQETPKGKWRRSVPEPETAEDYFSRRCPDTFRGTSPLASPRLSIDTGSNLSPRTNSPRTPSTDKITGHAYILSPSSSPCRSPTHIRGTSLDASQFQETKTRSSLLSQATSTAAVLAAKTSLPLSPSPRSPQESFRAYASSSPLSPSRNRPQSPRDEETQPPGSTSYSRRETPPTSYVIPGVSRWASTRETSPQEQARPLAPTAPLRNASWSSHEPRRREDPTFSTAGISRYTPHVSNTSRGSETPQPRRAQSQPIVTTISEHLRDTKFPLCPRPRPVRGYSDWNTLAGSSHITICPSCAKAVVNAGYGPLIRPNKRVSSSDWISCSFAEPWIRVAFVQSHKQGRKRLDFIREVSEPPLGCRPCRGNKSDVRTWWILRDPVTFRCLKGFYACSSCIRNVHAVFPNLVDEFEKNEGLQQEQVCYFQETGKHFASLLKVLDEVNVLARQNSTDPVSMQLFIDHVRRLESLGESSTGPVPIIKAPTVPEQEKCLQDTVLVNRPWHFAEELPEFTVCDQCYMSVVYPARQYSTFARNISMTSRLMPASRLKGINVSWSTADGKSSAPAISCQLYSDRTRNIFLDYVHGRLSYGSFVTRVRDRQALQHRIIVQNRMFAEDERMGRGRTKALEENIAWWRSLE